jgi:hypothetical protein
VDKSAALEVGAAFEAMLLAPLLRPMVAGADAIGEYGLDLLARQVAAHDAGGFGALLAAQFERRP